MLDPITSLLATCANCNPTNTSASQPVVAVCHAGPRSTPHTSPSTSLSTPCISPPEATPESLKLRSRTIATSAAANQSQATLVSQASRSPSSVAPESVVSVSWSNSKLLRLGSREQAVTRLQTQLKQLGFYAGAIDGIYGPQTKAAVAQFQRSKGLGADGVVGANTWAALQTDSRQPQSAKPSAPAPTPQTPADQPTTQTPPSPTPVPATATASPSAPETQSTSKIEDSSQFPLNYLWVLGWGIIYGSGWVLILKDTVKELNGFHFFAIANKKPAQQGNQQATQQPQKASKTAPKVVIHYPGNAQPSEAVSQQAAIDPQSVQPVTVAVSPTSNDADHSANHSANGRSNAHLNSHPNSRPNSHPNSHTDDDLSSDSKGASSNHARVEPFALHDPWQEENVEAVAVQILQVTLADAGQIQPIQNVFVVAPRPTHTRPRVKKPTSIYDVRTTRQRIKTG